ncbi:MAG: hypothetical protein ACJ8CR_26960 [Roseiflexaceae bacterium]
MTEREKRVFQFNDTGEAQVAENRVTIPPRDPIISLEEEDTITRHRRQLDKIAEARQTYTGIIFDDSLFDASLDWACRCYKVVDWAAPPAGAEPIIQQHLYLFNVIVALEWQPGARYMRQLEAAFRRASDFLYDVTDGYMAFGQVLFGGPELMDCADIQIMASNRLLPRSWVSGLVEEKKYLPIRMGRAAWHKNNRVSIPWDEPEAYRTLVHEWGHYALELRDEYLETQHVAAPMRDGHNGTPDQVLIRGACTLVLPMISLASQSIMATLEGTSELVPRAGGSSLERKREEWATISRRYPMFDPGHQPLEGPEHLPLALPRFHALGSLAGDRSAAAQSTNGGQESPTQVSQGDELVLKDFPSGMQLDHCWVYLLRGVDDTRHVIAQGTLDQRVEFDGFRLLDARKGDTVVLVGADERSRIVAQGTIDGTSTGEDGEPYAAIGQWTFVTPGALPMVDVLPGPVKPGDLMAHVKVHVTSAGTLPKQVWLCPFGQDQEANAPLKAIHVDEHTWTSEEHLLPTLDGHMLMHWDDGKMLISTFSQGGGPSTSVPGGPPPISAGSSEGNVMLFFENKEHTLDYSDVKVVTTLIHADSALDRLPDGAQARGYAFSLASNKALPVTLSPTLIMNFDSAAGSGSGDLLIYREVGNGQPGGAARWAAIPTYLRPGASFVAAPLDADTAPSLVAANPPGPRAERYRLYLVPHARPGVNDTAGA